MIASPIAGTPTSSTSYTAAGVGSSAPDGRLGEIFIEGPKDSLLLALARDTAIIASIALQYGAPASVILHALAGRDAGPRSPRRSAWIEGL